MKEENPLTNLQMRLLDQVARAKNNQEIASLMGMTRDEVVEELQLVKTALGVPDRTAAAVWFVKWQYSER